nr:beta-2 adrenergic receptor [Ciona intestinalis]|eukprot:XP_009860706.3 beta-2 adrenergic receptor [Ciona intestinalis]
MTEVGLNFSFCGEEAKLLTEANFTKCGRQVFCGTLVFCEYEAMMNTSLNFNASLKCSTAGLIINLVIMSLLSFIIIVGNGLVIYIMIKKRQFHNFQMCKMSLAFADILMGLIVIPGLIESMVLMFFRANPEGLSFLCLYERQSQAHRGKIVLYGGAATGSVAASLYSLLVLSGDRFFAVVRPFIYQRVIAPKRHIVKIILIVVWMVSIFLTSIPLFWDDITYRLPIWMFASAPLGSPCNMIASVFPIVVLAIPYGATVGLTLATLKITTRNLAEAEAKRGMGRGSLVRKESLVSTRFSAFQNNSETRQLMITVAIMITFFSMMMLPFTIMMPLIYSTIMPCRELNWLKLVASEFLMANSCVNFIVYNVRNKDFRESVKATLRLVFRYASYRRDKRKSSKFRKSVHRISRIVPSLPTTTEVNDDMESTTAYLPKPNN